MSRYAECVNILSVRTRIYKIEIRNLNLLAAEPGDFDIHESKRKTTGSFYFEGRFEDVSSYDFDFN